ncbi:MAG: CHAT domain-containing protein, partial [Reichenbachiella sp.]
FQVAGSKKIIMSLWKVNDAATKELMTSFYRYWMALGDPQIAFRKAQQKVKEEFEAPYYWGAFVMMN